MGTTSTREHFAPSLDLSVPRSKGRVIGFWIVTALFCLQMSFTAYAGFAINLASALIAHFSVGDGPESWSYAAGSGVLWGLSYFSWRRLHALPGERMTPR